MMETPSFWTEQQSPFEGDCCSAETREPAVAMDPVADLLSVFFAASFRSAVQTPLPEPKTPHKHAHSDSSIVSSFEQMLSSCYEQYHAVTGRPSSSASESSERNTSTSHADTTSKVNEPFQPDQQHSTFISHSATSRSRNSGDSRRRPVAVAVLDTLRDPQGRQVLITPCRARRRRLNSHGDDRVMRSSLDKGGDEDDGEGSLTYSWTD